jgi:hypothetical protein
MPAEGNGLSRACLRKPFRGPGAVSRVPGTDRPPCFLSDSCELCVRIFFLLSVLFHHPRRNGYGIVKHRSGAVRAMSGAVHPGGRGGARPYGSEDQRLMTSEETAGTIPIPGIRVFPVERTRQGDSLQIPGTDTFEE